MKTPSKKCTRTLRDPGWTVKLALFEFYILFTWFFFARRSPRSGCGSFAAAQQSHRQRQDGPTQRVYARWPQRRAHFWAQYGHAYRACILPENPVHGRSVAPQGSQLSIHDPAVRESNGDSLETPLYGGQRRPIHYGSESSAWAKQFESQGHIQNSQGLVIDERIYDSQSHPDSSSDAGNDGYLACRTHDPRKERHHSDPGNPGRPVAISCTPASPYHTCSSEVEGRFQGNLRFVTEIQGNVLRIKAVGTIAQSEPKVVNRVRSFDSARFAHALMVQTLKDIGFEVNENFARGKTPAGVPELLTHTSDTLAELVKITNRSSNNFYAENILKALGAFKGGEPGTTKKGLNAVYDFLARAGVKRSTVVLANGSGLFGNSMISPRGSETRWSNFLLAQAACHHGESLRPRAKNPEQRFAGTAQRTSCAPRRHLSSASAPGWLTYMENTTFCLPSCKKHNGDLQGAENYRKKLWWRWQNISKTKNRSGSAVSLALIC